MSSLPSPRISVQGIREYEEEHRPTSHVNVGEVERWASGLGGAVLVAQGLRLGTFRGLALAVAGGALIYRGVSGHCSAYSALNIDTSDKHQADETDRIHSGRLIKHSATINRSADDLYRFWRDVENAPKFMTNIESATRTGEKTSHWVSKGPMGKTFAWDSEIINDEPGHLIAWKSLPGGDVNQAGAVRFTPAPGGRGTVVTVEVNYEPPAGALGVAVAKLLGQDPDKFTRENLRHFQQLMEAGELATVAGQSSGRSGADPAARPLIGSV